MHPSTRWFQMDLLNLERSPEQASSAESPKSPADNRGPSLRPGPPPWTLQDHSGAPDALWLPRALGRHGPGHLGREEGSRALATSRGGGVGLASVLAWAQGCGIYNHPGAYTCLEQLFYFEAMSNWANCVLYPTAGPAFSHSRTHTCIYTHTHRHAHHLEREKYLV